MEILVDYLIIILEFFIYYRFINLNMNFKYKYSTRICIFAIILFTMILRKLEYSISFPFCSSVMDILLYAELFFVPLLFYNASIIKRITMPIIVLLLIAISEIGALALTALLLRKSMSELMDSNSTILYAFSILLPAVMLIIINFIYRKRNLDLLLPPNNRIEIFIILISNFTFILITAEMWRIYPNINISISNILAIMMLIIVINSIMSIVLLYKSHKRVAEQFENNLKMQQIEMENRLNKDMTEVVENLRSLRHDMNTHIGILKGLTDFEQYDELKKYLDSIYKGIKLSNSYIAIPHPALSILINSKISKANDMDIDFQPVVSISKLSMEDTDICALIGNLLENALEACSKVTNTKFISFQMVEKNNCCLIRCENPYAVKPIRKGDCFLTTKENSQWHGIGMKSIQSIVKKYKGCITISDYELFVVDISIPCCQYLDYL